MNTLIADGKQGRLFAIIHVAGKQFKVTDGDVIIIEGYWPPNVGDKISLDKVLSANLLSCIYSVRLITKCR